jgi:branched-chain amino acid transport system ATP-binding protein/nonpolar-amino-acid-transporting ATPase
VLRVDDLRSGYGLVPVLHGVSIEVGENEAVAVIGANGAGKSTLVRAICGLNAAMGGSVSLGEADLTRLPAHQRTRHGVAVVLEGRHLFGAMTVAQHLNLAAAKGLERGAAQQRFSVAEVSDLFPFLRERMQAAVELLSGGEQQMVAIARALLLQPRLLIMDEPSTGLAPKVVREIVAVVGQLRARGMSLILVEQNVAIAAETTERAYVMSVGRVVHQVRHGEWPAVLADDKLLRSYLGG